MSGNDKCNCDQALQLEADLRRSESVLKNIDKLSQEGCKTLAEAQSLILRMRRVACKTLRIMFEKHF